MKKNNIKRIVFITQWWPLHNSANVLCDYKIITELLKRRDDLEIHVICYKGPGEAEEEVVEGVHAHRVPLDLSTYLFLKANNFKSPLIKKLMKSQWRIITKLKQVFLLPLFPCFHPILEKRLLKSAIKNNTIYAFETIFADHAGFDTLMSGYKFSKKAALPFYPLLWDSLSCGCPVRYLSKKWQLKRRLKKEKEIINHCKSAFVLESNQEKIQELYKNDKTNLQKFNFIGVPYLPNEPFILNKSNDKNNSSINIIFGGSLHGREINPFLQAINNISKNIDVIVTFYTNEIFHKRIKKCINQFGLSDFVIIKGNVSHEEFVHKLSEADILLNFGNNTPEALPSKIFEYISMLKPIITTVAKENDASSLIIEKYCGGFVFKNSNSNCIKHIEDLQNFIMTAKELAKTISYKEIKAIFNKYTTDEVVNIIEKKCDL